MRKISFFKKLDWFLIFTVLFLCLFGLLEIWSASRGNYLNFKKQIFFFFLGFFLMLLFALFDWKFFRENPSVLLFLYFLSILLLLGLFFLALPTRGTKTWYRILVFSFDPSELAKISLLLILARYFSIKHPQIYNFSHIFFSFLYFFLPGILIFLQPNFGTFLILFALWLSILVFSGIRIRHFLVLLFLFAIVFLFSFNKVLKPYQRERILTFLFPQKANPLKEGWSQRQALIAIGSGGIFGRGLKKGPQTQMGFLPEPQGDFIFSAIAEETGFLGVSFLFLLYFLLFFRITQLAFSFSSNFAKLFSVGFLTLLVTQTFMHLASNLKLSPVIGITLPFVGYGGSNLLANFILLGILQSMKINE